MSIAIYSHEDCLKHDMGHGHPERAQRLRAIDDQLITSGIGDFIRYFDAPLATPEQLALAHSKEHINYIFEKSPADDSQMAHIDPDTYMNEYTLQAALRSAGAAIAATDLVLSDDTNEKHAFCSVRPPGHHAEYGEAMGFCFFNNIAIAARHAIRNHGLERVAVVDFDVHHGNGTEDIVGDDPQILFCSTYQHPLYPERAKPSKPGLMINAPLPEGAGGAEFKEAVNDHWLPALHEFKPQMIFISAGFDAHREDEMAGLRLVESDYQWVTERLCDIAHEYANGHIVSMLEGGYNVSALARSVVAHLKVLMKI
ncbi:MAG: deacetylase [Proteobacteria bacterium]|nr:MAG: deacetylase [Pseudomonadota bacterium]